MVRAVLGGGILHGVRIIVTGAVVELSGSGGDAGGWH